MLPTPHRPCSGSIISVGLSSIHGRICSLRQQQRGGAACTSRQNAAAACRAHVRRPFDCAAAADDDRGYSTNAAAKGGLPEGASDIIFKDAAVDLNPQAPAPSAARRALGFLERQFLPLGLLASLFVGYAWPSPGLALADANMQRFATIGIFVIQGLNLKRGEAAKALTSWGAALYGAAAILFVTPLLAIPVQRLSLGRPELAFGLAVFCCMPTALSSGVTLTTAVGGNTALALLLVIITNISGIFTMPFMLAALLRGGGGGVALSPLPLLRSLLQTIMAPLLVGVAARAVIPGAARTVDSNKRVVAIASACLLIMVPWMQISRARASNVAISAAAIGATVAAGAAIHLVFLAVNMAAVKVFRLGECGAEDGATATGIQRAVILVASQKTLPVAVTVLSQLAAAGIAPGAAGIAAVPAVIAHLSQIVMDSLLVSRWQAGDAAARQKPALA